MPLRGYSMLNREGETLYDRESNMAFVEAIQHGLIPEVELIRVDARINDGEFVDAALKAFLQLREAARSEVPS